MVNNFFLLLLNCSLFCVCVARLEWGTGLTGSLPAQGSCGEVRLVGLCLCTCEFLWRGSTRAAAQAVFNGHHCQSAQGSCGEVCIVVVCVFL